MLPSVWGMLAPLQFLAFLPLLAALRYVTRWRSCLHLGLLMGLGFCAPQILILQLPPAISAVLVVYFLVLLTAFVVVSWRFIQPKGVCGAFAFGAWAAVWDYVAVTVLPMWGTAQSFVRCWSAYPRAIAFTSLTGMSAVLFVVGFSQSLAIDLVLSPQRRVPRGLILVFVLALFLGADLWALRNRPTARLKVAAIGWAFGPAETGPGTPEGFERLYARPLAKAAECGARLVVGPETAFAIYDDPAAHSFSTFVELARCYDVYLAIGYLDTKSQENRIAFIGPTEGVMARYTKVHLTPLEDNPPGRGAAVSTVIDGVSVGAMICHDDNYTDIARRYGRTAMGVVVVPTNDWPSIRRAHFQSMIHRAIESRVALVRAASDGISAIVSPEGQVLARCDHCREGPGLVQAEVSVYSTRTVFSRFGPWFVPFSVLVLIVYCARRR